jgi:hypothetical protein
MIAEISKRRYVLSDIVCTDWRSEERRLCCSVILKSTWSSTKYFKRATVGMGRWSESHNDITAVLRVGIGRLWNEII